MAEQQKEVSTGEAVPGTDQEMSVNIDKVRIIIYLTLDHVEAA